MVLALLPALLLQVAAPVCLTSHCVTQYAYAIGPVLRRHGITVIEGCPPGLEGLYRPLARTLCLDPQIMDNQPEKAIRLMAHEITHVVQWCEGRALQRNLPALEAEAYQMESNPTLALRNLYRACANSSPP